MYTSVPVNTLKRLKARALREADELSMTCHKPEVFLVQAEGFQSAIDMEIENRARVAAAMESELLAEKLDACNNYADDVAFKAICWIFGIVGFTIAFTATYIHFTGGKLW